MLLQRDSAILRKPMSAFSPPPFEPIQTSTELSLTCTAKGEIDLSPHGIAPPGSRGIGYLDIQGQPDHSAGNCLNQATPHSAPASVRSTSSKPSRPTSLVSF